MLKQIADNIRNLRTNKGYTQEDFAKLLAMSPSGYAKLERGEVDISVTRLEQIAKEFEVKPTDLINVSGGATSIIFNITNSPAGGNNQSTIYVTADVQHLFTQMAGLHNNIAELQVRMEKLEKSI
jgi:transcriptional regulator with XRE-family HTH domain